MTLKNNTNAFGSPAKKRMAFGAVTVMTAGSLLGVGVAGASAAPLTAENTSSSASAESGSESGTHSGGLGALTKDLRADLQGATGAEKTEEMSDTLANHPELFESLPENLQADLTALNAAEEGSEAAAEKIETTALDGGYGEDIQKLAEEIQKDPTHPLAAALRGVLAIDSEQAPDAASPAATIASALTEQQALFDQLPADLQTDLTEQQALPEAEQSAAADELLASALEGGYGPEIQKITEQLQASIDGQATAEAEGDASTDDAAAGAGAEADAEAEGDVKSGQ